MKATACRVLWGMIVIAAAVAAGSPPDSLDWTPLVYSETDDTQFPLEITAQIVIRTGDPLTENPGYTFRRNPDFNVYFPGEQGAGYLFTNHEIKDVDPSTDFPAKGKENDSGGVTKLWLSPTNAVIRSVMHEWQTSYNCSGGITPWGTFLSCEENPDVSGADPPNPDGTVSGDGVVWEIDPRRSAGRNAVEAMGRFSHEAAEFDLDGNVYLTDDYTPGGFFKFVPAEKGTLGKGGTLYALDAVNRRWIPIENPRRARTEAFAKGASKFARPEGVARHPKRPNLIYFAVTGQCPPYDHPWGGYPRGAILALDIETTTLHEIVVGADQDDRAGLTAQLQNPDNIRFDENGTLFICEDHENKEFTRDAAGRPLNEGRNELLALPDGGGTLYRFAILGRGKSEWTGPFFARTGRGKTLFVTSQEQGWVYALTGFRSPAGKP